MIHKETSSTGETYVYMNGHLLYKKWPDGSSILFEKHGFPTRNHDRDRGNYGSPSVSKRELEAMSEHPIVQMVKSAVEADPNGWLPKELDQAQKRRTEALLIAVVEAFVWRAGHGMGEAGVAELRDHLNIRRVVDLSDPVRIPFLPDRLRRPVRAYLESIPGFRHDRGYEQTETVREEHGLCEMHLTSLLGSFFNPVTLQ